MLPVPCRKAAWLPSGALGLPAVKPLPLPLTPAARRELPGRAVGRVLEGFRRQRRHLEAAVADRVRCRRDRHQVDEGGVVAAQRVQADEADGVRPGRYREIRRLVQAVIGVGGGDQAHLGAVDQHLDLLIMLVAAGGALGGLERKAVTAGIQVHRLAHAAGALQEGLLAAVGALGLPALKALPLLLTPADPENCQDELLGTYRKCLRRQSRRLETAVADGVCLRRDGHQVEQGGVVSA